MHKQQAYLQALADAERAARGSHLQRLAFARGRYVLGMIHSKLLYPLGVRRLKRNAPLFFGGAMEVGLPAGLDLYLLGAKSHESEIRLARFLGKDDSILFAACFDANGGLFEPLLGPEDAIISDALNHASVIDGIRLCKAQRYRYANSNMDELEARLVEARDAGARFIMIATDGVFSMDGYLAELAEITELAERYGALVMVDDCHATGFMGPKGRGTPHHAGVEGKVDIMTGTLGKALGGALGGFVAGPQAVVDLLRQRARPYLFSNALPPAVVAAGLAALDLVEAADDLRARLFDNAAYWRAGLADAGFRLLPGEHPIVPVMLGDAALSQRLAAELFERGIYVAGFFFPVVPKGQARIRTQMNARLTRDDLDFALDAFRGAGKAVGAL